jgi:site-specific DNA-methyltransferase (adenine-specific)
VTHTSKALFTNYKLQEKREMTYQILHGNNLDILPTLADNSIDSIITDPPYELGFMGKKWDSSGIAYSVELWQQCLRVLKPGGHLLSFGGTRTYHRVAVAIEDAGFELRDSIAWLYGSGFPKSLDVSKAIDKLNGKPRPTKEFRDFLRAGKTSVGLTSDQIDKELGFTSAMFSPHYVGDNPQIEYPTKEKYKKLKELLKLDESFDYLIDWAEAEREVTGHYTQPAAADTWMANYSDRVAGAPKEKKEKPSTPEAQTWQGWGTALKPAFEPVIVARKPIEGTVANNVLKWGTGGLNIDGSRIGTTVETWPASRSYAAGQMQPGHEGKTQATGQAPSGRWPANIILDPYTAELLDEQSGQTKSGNIKPHASNNSSTIYGNGSGFQPDITGSHIGDSGGASRFFYVAKASKRDRNEGLEELPDTHPGEITGRKAGSAGAQNGGYAGMTETPRKNIHPTVKPTSLMEYLIKLVTPPNGTVLDPFTGSGSTGKAAILQGFDFIGIEMTEEYLPIIEGRLKHAERIVAERNKEASLLEQEKLF